MMLAKRIWTIGCLAGLMALLATACVAPTPAPPPATPADVTFVIPPGAEASLERGEPSFQFPEDIVLQAGQSVVVSNQDYAMHYFFDIPIAPGQTIRKAFPGPGTFVYQGGMSCSMPQAPGAIFVQVN
jgi:hypothetical protein